jgi:uncharacterized membrane protein YhaH (DUF805 family)
MYDRLVPDPDRTRREHHAENAAVRMPGLEPPTVWFHHDTRRCTGFVGEQACWNAMEELFEFLFGASGRINRIKYWRSLLIFCGAGLLVGVILLTAAGLAAPLFILMLVIVFIPWLLWRIAFHTERLHDRGKSAWWLLMFYAVPGVLGQLAKGAWFGGAAGNGLHYVLALAGFVLSIWGFVEIGCLRGTAGPNNYGSNPLSVHAARG